MVPFSTPMHCVTHNLGSGPHFWNSATFRWITMHVWYSRVQRLTRHIDYRSFRGRFYRPDDPTNSII